MKTNQIQNQPRKASRDKVVSAAVAVAAIQNRVTIATVGFVGIGFSEQLTIALEERFLATRDPRELSFIYAVGQEYWGNAVKRAVQRVGLYEEVTR